jgi:hypothetical protein
MTGACWTARSEQSDLRDLRRRLGIEADWQRENDERERDSAMEA